MSIGATDKFSENELNDAVNCVKKSFKSYNGATLTKLWYDKKNQINLLRGI